MVGRIIVSGSGRITPGDDGTLSTWTVSESATPIAIGQPSAATGGLSFTGVRDEEDGHYSEWTVAESATFTHEGDGSASFGSIDGAISNVTVSGSNASGSMTTILQRLNAERSMPTLGSYTQYQGVVLPNPLDGNFPANAGISLPGDIAFDSSGNLFLADRGNNRIVKFTNSGSGWIYQAATGDTSGSGAGTGNGQFGGSGQAVVINLAIDSLGRVYATDPWNSRVQRFSNNLVYQAQFGTPGTGNGQFASPGPTGIAIDATGDIFVSDYGNARIQRFSSAHAYEAQWAAGTGAVNQGAYSLAVDSNGDIYAPIGSTIQGTSANSVVRKYSPSGTLLGEFGAPGADAGQFALNSNPSSPYDITIDGDGKIYVVDPGNNRIQRFLPDFTFDGMWGSFGSGPGQMSAPRSVATGPDGTIYISDYGNDRVITFTPGTGFTQPLSEYFRDYLELVIPGIYDPLPTPSRVNWVANPSPQDPVQTDNGWSFLGSPATAGRQSGTGVDGDYGYVVTWSGTDAGSSSGGGYISSLNVPEPNTILYPSIYARLDIAAAARVLQMRITFSDSGGTISSDVSNPVSVADNGTYTRLTMDPVYVPVGTETISITVFCPNQAVDPWVTGDKLFLDQASTAPGDYFDGAAAPEAGHINSWSGTPYASQSEDFQRGFMYQADEDPEVSYPGWRDNVWTKLNELCAATHTELALVGGSVVARDAGVLSLSPGEDVANVSIAVDTLNLARAVDIVYQNVQGGDGVVMYDARNDENRIFSIGVGQSEVFTVTTNSYPVVVNNPSPIDGFLIGPGQYHVTGSDNLPVIASQWTDYGGSVTVAVGDNPNDIDITLTGPAQEIPGVPGPYSLAASDGSSTYATLSITGSGLTTNPQTLHLYTGADPNLVTQETQTTITNIHITDLAAAYDRGVWASDLACGPNVTLSATMGFSSGATDTQVFGLYPGRLVNYADSRYRIVTVSIQNSNVSFTAVRHVTSGDEEREWEFLDEITNYSENPSIEVSTAGFNAGTLTTLSRSNVWASSGTWSLRLSTTSNAYPVAYIGSSGPSLYEIPWGMVPGETYTISADIHSEFPGSGSWLADAGRIMVYYGLPGSGGGLLGFSNPLDEFTVDARQSVTFTIPADATGVRVDFYATGIGTNWYAYWDSFLLTEGSSSYEFFDGDTPGATWSGAVGLSASSKEPNSAGDYAAFWDGEPAKNAIIRPLRTPES